MNTKKIKTRFGRETRFGVVPRPPPALCRDRHEVELEQLKGRLLRRALTETADPELEPSLRRAANEAAALAWATWYPLLLFPELFEEKTRTAARQAERQAEIRRQSLAWL